VGIGGGMDEKAWCPLPADWDQLGGFVPSQRGSLVRPADGGAGRVRHHLDPVLHSGAPGQGPALHQPTQVGGGFCGIHALGRGAVCAASSGDAHNTGSGGVHRSESRDRSGTVMAKKVLVTGGAGFVGSHVADALLRRGHSVRVFDNLTDQVHTDGFPAYLAREVEFMQGDMRNLTQVRRAVRNVDVIFHLAAAVGVGQSMYEISRYMAANTLGTANLLQALLDTKSMPEKLVVASSMSIYGEGKYVCSECGEVAPPPRSPKQLREKQWQTRCPGCGRSLQPVPTDESKPLQCTSIYALSKKDQEEMTLLFGRTYDVPVVALRYFNIYGTRQALSNPYTGVAAIFAARLMNDASPLIFEDG